MTFLKCLYNKTRKIKSDPKEKDSMNCHLGSDFRYIESPHTRYDKTVMISQSDYAF